MPSHVSFKEQGGLDEQLRDNTLMHWHVEMPATAVCM